MADLGHAQITTERCSGLSEESEKPGTMLGSLVCFEEFLSLLRPPLPLLVLFVLYAGGTRSNISVKSTTGTRRRYWLRARESRRGGLRRASWGGWVRTGQPRARHQQPARLWGPRRHPHHIPPFGNRSVIAASHYRLAYTARNINGH